MSPEQITGNLSPETVPKRQPPLLDGLEAQDIAESKQLVCVVRTTTARVIAGCHRERLRRLWYGDESKPAQRKNENKETKLFFCAEARGVWAAAGEEFKEFLLLGSAYST